MKTDFLSETLVMKFLARRERRRVTPQQQETIRE
jgi:hypothetical protein